MSEPPHEGDVLLGALLKACEELAGELGLELLAVVSIPGGAAPRCGVSLPTDLELARRLLSTAAAECDRQQQAVKAKAQ